MSPDPDNSDEDPTVSLIEQPTQDKETNPKSDVSDEEDVITT